MISLRWYIGLLRLVELLLLLWVKLSRQHWLRTSLVDGLPCGCKEVERWLFVNRRMDFQCVWMIEDALVGIGMYLLVLLCLLLLNILNPFLSYVLSVLTNCLLSWKLLLWLADVAYCCWWGMSKLGSPYHFWFPFHCNFLCLDTQIFKTIIIWHMRCLSRLINGL
jgi:hypothetical protein